MADNEPLPGATSTITTTIDVVDNHGHRQACLVSFGMPYLDQNETGEAWACRVVISALNIDRLIFGNDGFQSLVLGIGYVVMLLSSHRERGGQIFFPDTDIPVVLTDSRAFTSLFNPLPSAVSTSDDQPRSEE